MDNKKNNNPLNDAEKQLLFAFLKAIFGEINQTNQVSIIVGLLSASTDSALYWALSYDSCEILAQGIGLSNNEKQAFKTIVSLCSVFAVSAIDIYAAKGMVEQAQHIFKRREILPTHFTFLIKMLGVFLVINAFAIIGPAGLIYQEYANDASKATYLAIAESITNLLAGSFFMLNMAEEIKKVLIKHDSAWTKDKQTIIAFIDGITNYLTELDEQRYAIKMTNIYQAIKEENLENLFINLEEAKLSTPDWLNNKNEEKIDTTPLLTPYSANSSGEASSKNIFLDKTSNIIKNLSFSFVVALFSMVNISWLYFLVGLSYVLALIPGSNVGALNGLRYISALSYTTMYGSIAFYSGLNLSNELLHTNKSQLTTQTILVNSSIFILSCLASLIVIVLVSQTADQGKDYLYYGAFLSTLIINMNAIRHIDLPELFIDFTYDCKVLASDTMKCFLPRDTDRLLADTNCFFPSQKEIKRKLNSLIHAIEYSSKEDIQTLAQAYEQHLPTFGNNARIN